MWGIVHCEAITVGNSQIMMDFNCQAQELILFYIFHYFKLVLLRCKKLVVNFTGKLYLDFVSEVI